MITSKNTRKKTVKFLLKAEILADFYNQSVADVVSVWISVMDHFKIRLWVQSDVGQF